MDGLQEFWSDFLRSVKEELICCEMYEGRAGWQRRWHVTASHDYGNLYSFCCKYMTNVRKVDVGMSSVSPRPFILTRGPRELMCTDGPRSVGESADDFVQKTTGL